MHIFTVTSQHFTTVHTLIIMLHTYRTIKLNNVTSYCIHVCIVQEAINPQNFVKILMVSIFAMPYCTALKF